MTTFSPISPEGMLIDLGIRLAPVAWALAAIAIGACVALVVAAVYELRRSDPRTTFPLVLPRADERPAGVRPATAADFNHAA